MGVADTLAPEGIGYQDLTKMLDYWMDLLGQPLSRKPVFNIFGSEPSSLKNANSIHSLKIPYIVFFSKNRSRLKRKTRKNTLFQCFFAFLCFFGKK